MSATLYAVSFVLPLVAGLAAVLLRQSPRETAFAHATLIVSGAVGIAASIWFAFGLAGAGPSGVGIFSFGALAFLVTPLSAFFAALVFVGVTLTSWFSLGYLPRYRTTYALPWLDAASALFIFGMLATLFAGNPFTFLLGWELMSVPAYFLIIADPNREALAAGFRYLLMAQIGFVSLLAGFMLLAAGNLFLPWALVAGAAARLSPLAAVSAFLLLFAGFGSKAGLVPLHQWLPYAHPMAPSSSSALLSGVMLKVALYGFVLTLGLFPALPLSWAALVILLGLLSAFFGVLHAVVENDAKRMLAWSSIENMGLLFTGVGLLMAMSTFPPSALLDALRAAVTGFVALHTLNHALFKSGLFMATGAVVAETHTRELDALGGLARAWPVFSGAFLVLALSAAALPPTGTFFGEWLLLQSLALAFSAPAPSVAFVAALVLGVVALVGGLALFAFVKLFSVAFLGRARSQRAEHVAPLPKTLALPPMVAAALVALSGLYAFPFFSRIVGLPTFREGLGAVIVPGASLDPLVVFGALALALAAVAFAYARLSPRRAIRVTDTWDCGTPLSPRMQYTATGFVAPIRFFFRSIVLAQKELVAEPIVATNPWIARRRLTWATGSFWERSVYEPVGKAVVGLSQFARRLQNGSVQFYLLLVFVALVVTIIVAL